MVVVVHLNDDGGGACRVVGEGGELVQPAGRGRGGCGGGGGGLLQLAHPEGTPAPGDPACSACVRSPVKVHEPLEPTMGPAWIQTRASEAPLAFQNDRV